MGKYETKMEKIRMYLKDKLQPSKEYTKEEVENIEALLRINFGVSKSRSEQILADYQKVGYLTVV